MSLLFLQVLLVQCIAFSIPRHTSPLPKFSYPTTITTDHRPPLAVPPQGVPACDEDFHLFAFITVYLFYIYTMMEWKALRSSLTPHLLISSDFLICRMHVLRCCSRPHSSTFPTFFSKPLVVWNRSSFIFSLSLPYILSLQ